MTVVVGQSLLQCREAAHLAPHCLARSHAVRQASYQPAECLATRCSGVALACRLVQIESLLTVDDTSL